MPRLAPLPVIEVEHRFGDQFADEFPLGLPTERCMMLETVSPADIAGEDLLSPLTTPPNFSILENSNQPSELQADLGFRGYIIPTERDEACAAVVVQVRQQRTVPPGRTD